MQEADMTRAGALGRLWWLSLMAGGIFLVLLLSRPPATAQTFVGCCQCAIDDISYCLDAQVPTDCP